MLLALILAACGPTAPDDKAPDAPDTPALVDTAGVDSSPHEAPDGRLLITELMADNKGTIELSDNSSPDWIELYNPGPAALDLAGWTLSDAPEDDAPPPLPALSLAPGAFVVLYATGESGVAADGRLTLPFKLDADGESLTLRDAEGALVDAVRWGPQVADVSWGRAQAVAAQVLLDDGDAARLSPGAPEGWAEPALDDSAWREVVLPVGMDAGVEAAEDLALFAEASQSSDWSSAYPAANAVDGEGSTFTHTATADFAPWWQADLGATGTLRAVTLHNRLSCCGERLYNIQVQVLDEAGEQVWASEVLNPVAADEAPTSPGDTLDAGLTEAVRGRVLRVSKTAVGGTYESEWLSLGEVEAWGQWSAPYADQLATDITAELADGAGEVTLRVPVAGLGEAPDRLTLELRADDAAELRWAGAPLASWNLDTLEDVEVDAPTPLNLDPSLAVADALLAVRLLDVGGDDALLGLRLVAERIETELAAGEERFFRTPTPGAPNGEGFPGFAEAPVADPPRGWIEGPTTVTLSTATPGATLIYTLDGSVPGADNGVAVDAASTTLEVEGTTLLRAVAVLEGWGDSAVATHTWLSMADVLAQPAAPPGLPATWDGLAQAPVSGDYEMDPEVVTDPAYTEDLIAGLRALPALSIVLPHADLWGEAEGIYVNSTQRGSAWERAASVELLEPGGGSFQGDCGLRIHGYGWRPHANTKKHSFRLEFRRDYGEGKLEYPLFPEAPVERFDSVVLRAQGSRSWQDFRDPEQAQYIRDAFARDTALAMGKADGHAAYVHLFLNGLYWGLYMAVERPDADFGAERFGGEAEEYDAINRRTTTNEAIDGDLEAYNTLLALADADLSVDANYRAVAEMIDVDDLIDYMLIHQYTANRDGPELFSHNNMRGVRRRVEGERFRFFVWDMEYSLWEATDDINIDVDVPGSASHVYARLRSNPEFRARYAERAALHLGEGGALSPEAALARYEARAAEIFDAVVAESARWGDTDRAAPYTRDVEWAEEYQRLTEQFFPVRTAVLIAQLEAAGLY